MPIGERLRQLRELANLSQNQLAQKAKVSQSVISGIESGRRTSLNLTTAKRLAQALGVSLDLLAGRGE